MTRILLGDADAPFRRSLAESLRLVHDDVIECSSRQGMRELLTEATWDLILIDVQLPGRLEGDILSHVSARAPGAVLVALTAQGSIEGAVQALHSGAEEYLVKPLRIDKVLEKIDEILRARDLKHPRPGPFSPGSAEGSGGRLVGTSLATANLTRAIERAARADSTVLIAGETGTGKELVARGIHRAGPRRDRPFVAVNCSALPESLLESQLFGHQKGAFTGADRDRRGILETAAGGTIFLDEIGEMPLSLQSKILRPLDAREFFPIGSTTPLPVTARFIAATNCDLKSLVQAGRFREDLYYRLTPLEIPIPPLRERPEDIPVIARHLLTGIAASMNRDVPELDPAVLMAFEHHDWPGNVRELANVLERAMILNEGPTIALEDLPRALTGFRPPSNGSLRTARNSFERIFIRRVLNACGGDRVRAARRLEISLSSLYRKLGLPDRDTGCMVRDTPPDLRTKAGS